MALHNNNKKVKLPNLSSENKIAMHGGSYSLIITAVVLAILVLVNVFVSILPKSLTKLDISSSRLYSITSNTKTVVNNLKDDVTIYWVVQSGEEDEIIDNLLGKYESLSEHIEVVKKNPDIYPTFTEKYSEEPVQNNSIIVECGDKNRFIGPQDIYIQETDMATYSYNSSFDGEGAITSAIDYVVSDNSPNVYTLEGHGELALPSKFKDQIEKANMELHTLSLLNTDTIPDDADIVLIYAPQNDISDVEANILKEYVNNGGKMFVSAGPVVDETLDNLYSILESYGIETTDGIIVEADRSNFAFKQPHAIMAKMEPSNITQSLIDENYYPIMPISNGVTITDEANISLVHPILSSSPSSYSKIDGYNLETYEKEDGDIDGPFTLALEINTSNKGKIIWFNSAFFLDDMYNSYSSGANVNLAMNSMYQMIGQNDAMTIRSKSLNYDYLTISESQGAVLKVLMIGVFPAVYLGIGITIAVKRRRKNNEEK